MEPKSLIFQKRAGRRPPFLGVLFKSLPETIFGKCYQTWDREDPELGGRAPEPRLGVARRRGGRARPAHGGLRRGGPE